MKTSKLSIKKKIDFLFAGITVIFAILIYSTYNSAEAVRQNRMVLLQTGDINATLEKVLSSTIDIETGTRGYAITGRDNYLEVYTTGNENAKLWMDSLRSMNKNDESHLKRLDSIEKLIHAKRQISAKTIAARRHEGRDQAAKIVETGRGKEIMDSLRVIIADFQKNQLRLLASRLVEIDSKVRERNFYFLIFVCITVTLLVTSYRIIRRNADRMIQKNAIQNNLIDELSIQNVQMNDFANITSHNLRSPAANITSLISVIDEKSGIDDYKMIFEMLKKVSQNLNETLNQLLEVLQIKRNKTIERENIRLETVFSKTLESLQGEILVSKATVSADFSQAPEIFYPKIYIESIFHNLLSNALKYRSPDRLPEISVRSEIKENYVLLSVADNGLGIDLNRHGSKLFGMHKFFHDHPDAKGIGLFITKTQIESMDGKIAVQSEVGKGTAFTVYFLIK